MPLQSRGPHSGSSKHRAACCRCKGLGCFTLDLDDAGSHSQQPFARYKADSKDGYLYLLPRVDKLSWLALRQP
eukprot:1454079-Rhodomonas_salina.2